MSKDFKISLGLSNLRKSVNLNLDYTTSTATLNGKPINLDVRNFMNKICEITSSWEEKMINENILDGLSYFVYIQKDGKIKKYEGQNKFPKNFSQFIILLDEVNEW